MGGFLGICSSKTICVFPKIGIPQNGWFIMENPVKMDDLGIPLFSETSICVFWRMILQLRSMFLNGLGSTISRRWQLKLIFYFHPDPWGFMIQFDGSTRIFFRMGWQKTHLLGTLRILTPPMETPDPPNDTPGALKQVVLTPHDIPWSLRVKYLLLAS